MRSGSEANETDEANEVNDVNDVDDVSGQHERVLRASEIGQYAYCARAWWLGSIEGKPSSHQREMIIGEAEHRRHGQRLRAGFWLSRFAWLLLLLAAAIGILELVKQP